MFSNEPSDPPALGGTAGAEPTNLPNPLDVGAVRAWLTDRAPAVPAVRAWTSRLLADFAPDGWVPALGTPAWCALNDTDPRKVAAALTPALARLVETTPAAVALRLRHELAAENRAVVNRIKAASLDLSAAQDWTHAARRPSFAELERRRADVPPTRPRCLPCAAWEPCPTHVPRTAANSRQNRQETAA
jgi:hypothetical protein